MYQIGPCTVNYRHKVAGHSGILFKTSHILTTASQFLLSLLPNQRNLIIKKLKNNDLITAADLVKEIQELPGFLVTVRQSENLVQADGHVKLIFNCRTARRSLNSVLSGFKHESKVDLETISLLFSTFLVIGLSSKSETKNEILTNILQQTGGSVNFSKMDKIHTESSLFGSDSFFGTYNSGIIANIFDDSVMILSIPLVQGCEGGGVFSCEPRKKLLGIIVASAFHWKKDNVTLTLAVRLDQILNELIQLDQGIQMEYVPTKKLEVKTQHKGESCVALIDCLSSWGCGAFVNFCGRKFLITCSHVLDGTKIKVYWKHGKYKPTIIYKNPHFNKAFDIALLTPPENAPNECFTDLATYIPSAGMKVFNVGFPLISSMAKRNFSPFIFEGTVTSYSPGFLTSDSLVQAGQSGGPLFDSQWRLLGVCVSNTRDDLEKKIFPSINMAVPIRDIFIILEKFIKSEDLTALNQLIAPEDVQKRWNLEIPVFRTKL